MNIAFLFGAGASLGAGVVEPETPPSGAGLYQSLKTAFPRTWGEQIAPDEDELFRSDPPFELGMQALWDKNDARVQQLITDMALYFTRFRLPDGRATDCYSQLVRTIGDRNVNAGFATLNYECLLEIAINRGTGQGIDYLLSGNPAGGVPVMKLHGSCNFLPVIVEFSSDIGVEGAAGSARYYEGPLKAVLPEEMVTHYSTPNIPPAISLFSSGKHSPVSADEIDQIRARWKDSAANADVIVVIGARPVLADAHVWTPILDADADVWHIGGSTGLDFVPYGEALGSRLRKVADRFDSGLPKLQRYLDIVG